MFENFEKTIIICKLFEYNIIRHLKYHFSSIPRILVMNLIMLGNEGIIKEKIFVVREFIIKRHKIRNIMNVLTKPLSVNFPNFNTILVKIYFVKQRTNSSIPSE